MREGWPGSIVYRSRRGVGSGELGGGVCEAGKESTSSCWCWMVRVV